MKDFIVDYALLCDFATQDMQQKTVLAGVYGPEMSFPPGTSNWPQLHLVTVLLPLKNSFKFTVSLRNHRKKNMISLAGTFEIQKNYPGAQLSIHSGIPPLPFEGPGTYSIVVEDSSGKTVFTKLLYVSQEPIVDRAQPQVTANVSIGS